MGADMKVLGSNKLLDNIINGNLCTGCGACIDLCPYFKSYKGKTVMLFPCTIPRGKCFAYCPRLEVDLDYLSVKYFGKPYGTDPLGFYQSIVTSRAGGKFTGNKFQAGGTASAIMYFALERGYIDGAVLTGREGLLPEPRIVTHPEDVLSCALSMYTAAPTLSAVHSAMRKGLSRIGVVSTPCQTLSAALMRTNPLEENDFTDPIDLVVGIFCTWALDFRVFEPFVSSRVDINTIEKTDIPPPPAEVMEIHTNEGETVPIPLDEIRTLIPDACSYCIDMTSEFADISVGVLEGDPGRNTIIIRTERGKMIVDEAVREGYLIVDDMPEMNLIHLKHAAGNKKKRALKKAYEAGMVNNPAEDEISYLRLHNKTLKEIIG